jgi:hypothetical protein
VINGLINDANKAKRLNSWLFSLNIGFASSYALFAYDDSSYIAMHAPQGVRHFLEVFGGILRRIAPLGVHLRTRSQHLRSENIREGVFVGLVFGIAIILYLVVLPLSRTVAGRRVFVVISGIAALVAVPGLWLYIVHATWQPSETDTFWGTYGYIFIFETALAGVFIFPRNQAVWRSSIVFVAHYIFWIVFVIREGNVIAPIVMSIPLSLVFPFAGYAWLRYVGVQRAFETQ